MSSELTVECISGVTHEGTPRGRIEKIAEIDTYVSFPPDGQSFKKEKVVLILTDVFGLPLVNNKLLADDFASNGFQVYMPDLFDGDGYPLDALNQPSFDREAWRARHPFNGVVGFVDKVYAELQNRGIKIYGATGYCFGAPYVLHYANSNRIQAAVLSHPSRLEIPKTFEDLIAHSKAPLLINSCEVDPAFPEESQKIADELLGEGKYKPGYKRTYWEGCTHGFAVRGDMSNPKIKAGREGSFKASAEWFLAYL